MDYAQDGGVAAAGPIGSDQGGGAAVCMSEGMVIDEGEDGLEDGGEVEAAAVRGAGRAKKQKRCAKSWRVPPRRERRRPQEAGP